MEYYAIVVSERYSKDVLFNLFPIRDLDYYRVIDIDNIDIEELTSKKNHYLEVSKSYLYEFGRLPFATSFSKNQWFYINISEHNGAGYARFYESVLSEESNNVEIESINFIDQRTREGRTFREIFNLKRFNLARVNEIEEELIRRDVNDLHLAVYNVGQGSCNAICDSIGKPQIYFDLGGGYGGHSRTYPNHLNLCKCDNPLIILSHWDGDHWKTSRVNPDFEYMTWIVPQQKISADAFKTVLAILTKGRLLIYPKGSLGTSSTNFNIIQCQGKSINDSGLALEVKFTTREYLPIAPVALLPGDAKYKFIPITECRFNYLVVTHHGAKNPTLIPNPINESNCHVYSYGKSNTYGHPNSSTIRSHIIQGWDNKKSTVNGHIALGGGNFSTYNDHVQVPTNNCNASIVNIYN